MNKKILAHLKIALYLEERARRIEDRPAERADHARLRVEVARQYQHAYRIPVEMGVIHGSLLPKGHKAKRKITFLARCVRMTSHTLIHSENTVLRAEQIAVAAEGLSLLGASDPALLFGKSSLRAIYGRTLDEVRELKPLRAEECLDKFEEQCTELTVGKDVRLFVRDFIDAERRRLEGKPIRLTAFKNPAAQVEAYPYPR